MVERWGQRDRGTLLLLPMWRSFSTDRTRKRRVALGRFAMVKPSIYDHVTALTGHANGEWKCEIVLELFNSKRRVSRRLLRLDYPVIFHQPIWATRCLPAPIRQIHFWKWIKGTALRIRHMSRRAHSTCCAKISSIISGAWEQICRMIDQKGRSKAFKQYKGTKTTRDIKTSAPT